MRWVRMPYSSTRTAARRVRGSSEVVPSVFVSSRKRSDSSEPVMLSGDRGMGGTANRVQ